MTENHNSAASEGKKKIERLIDANINRLREGLRTIEDIARYIMNDPGLSGRLKELRHAVKRVHNPERLFFRDAENDVLKESTESEMNRKTLGDILSANFSRTQESCRVLEECFKLTKPSHSALFKQMRYAIYTIEKEFFDLFRKRENLGGE